MPQFRYQALNADEQLVAGEIEAESVAQAIGQLETSGLSVQSIGYSTGDKPTGERANISKQTTKRSEKKPQHIVTAEEQAELDRQLTRIIERARSLAPALRAYAAEMSRSQSRRQLLDLLTVLDMSDTPQAVVALQRLPAFWIPLLAAATKSDDPGRMIQVFVRESNRATELARLWRRTLVYPLVLICAASAVMVFLSLLVIPVFRKLFEDFGLKLPTLTQAILTAAEWISDGRFFVIAGSVAMGAYVLTKFVEWGVPEGLRNWLSDRFGKPLGRSTAIAQFSQYLADLLEADFALASALRLAGAAADSPRVRRAAWRTAGEIDGGDTRSLANRRVLTSSVLYAVAVEVPLRSRIMLLRELSRCHGERAARLMSWTRGFVEPLAIVFVGFVVGAVVIGLFLPLLSLIQGLS
jgi:type IV pilus assembly protein PilC